MKQTVCVTGGSGGIGQALLERLIDRYEVKALFRARTELSDAWTERGCTPIWGDLSNEAALSELVQGARFAFHCAAVTQGPYGELYAVNVEGTRRMAQMAASHGCGRFVHVSSVAVYSLAHVESAYTEDLPIAARDDMAVYSLTKLQSELALRDVCHDRALEFTIIRPTCVYGPGTKSFTLTPIELIRRGLPVSIGEGRGLMDAVYVDDVADALVAAAESSEAPGEVFNIGHETLTCGDFYRYYGRMLNRPVRRLPTWLLEAIVRLIDAVPMARRRRIGEIQRGVRFLLATARNTKTYPSDKARRLLGYRPRFALELGMLRTELWARRQRLVGGARRSLDSYGVLPFRPTALVHPASEQELVEIVNIARAANLTVRAIGALHSQSPVPYTDGICVVLDRYNQVLKIEGSTVTVQAGMQLRALHRALAQRGLATPVSGTISEQTVAGAISTATHGGTIYHGALSDYVEAVRIVRSDGTVVEYDNSEEPFHALVVSLGLLGILSTITLRCVPSFYLQSRTSVRRARDVIEHFDQINRGSRFVDMLYYTVLDQVEILSIDDAADQRADVVSAPPPVAADPRPPWWLEATVVRRITVAALRSLAWLVLRHASLQRFVTGFSSSHYEPRTGPSYEVLAFEDREGAVRTPGVLRDMEFAVPHEQAAAALGALREHFITTQRFPLLPIHIRCSARGSSWLSPTYERDVCWIEFWQFPPSDAFSEQMQALLEPFHYRFHWGKASGSAPAYIARQYERWPDFLELRRRWDPHGMFANQYLDAFFGAASMPISEETDAP